MTSFNDYVTGYEVIVEIEVGIGKNSDEHPKESPRRDRIWLVTNTFTTSEMHPLGTGQEPHHIAPLLQQLATMMGKRALRFASSVGNVASTGEAQLLSIATQGDAQTSFIIYSHEEDNIMDSNTENTMAAPNWPSGVPSRNRNLRRRAEAFASAVYYSECSLSGISPGGAAAAEENARSHQSRWWLRGNDPNHPSLQCHRPEGAEIQEETPENPKPDQAQDTSPPVDEDHATDEENESDAMDAQEDDEDLIDDGPILARDDDLGSSFGALSSFCTSHHSAPSWLAGPTVAAEPVPSRAPKQEEGSSEEMLASYYASHPSQLLEQKSEQSRLSTSPIAVAQVSSESEADSIYSGSLSCDGSSVLYPTSRVQRVESNVPGVIRSKKRARDDFASLLDQTYLDAKIDAAKAELLSCLRSEGIGPSFQSALASLEQFSKLKSSSSKRRKDCSDIDGTWVVISPPEYPSSLGKNDKGERLFSLGRMSFDMFQPANLVCSIQHQYNTIHRVKKDELPLYVPKSLSREVDNERNGEFSGKLKTYK